MSDHETLEAALTRLLARTATDQDVTALRRIFADRSVHIEGDANGATIITGDDTVILSLPGATRNAVIAALDALFPRALFQLPPPPQEFTGRTDDLDDLLAHIDDGGATISGVRGMGGIGKTALALKLAERIRARFPDAQFYLDLKGTTQPLTPAQAMQHVIRGYHPTTKLPDEEAELHPLYHSLLNGKRILLLMDNARDAAQVTPLIPPPGCCLLVTSRWHFAIRGCHTRDLSTLPAEEARNLLLRLTPRIADKAHEIAQLCGRLPLALCLAAGVLAARADLPVEQYIQRLQDNRERLRQLDRYRDLTDEQLGVEASLDLSYALLTPELQTLWRALAVFPETFDVAAAAAVWNVRPDDARERLGDLRQHSMVEWEAPADRYGLHDLARAFADGKLDDANRMTACQRHAERYLSVLWSTYFLYEQGGEKLDEGLALFDMERPNIDAGQHWAAQHAAANPAAARLCCDYPDPGVYCLDLRQHPRNERVPWLEAAVAAARRLPDRRAEGCHLGNLGNAYLRSGEPGRAIEHYERHLAIAIGIPDRLGEGNALGSLGLAYATLGQPRRAIVYYEQQLAIVRELHDRRGEGSALGNLGNAYADLHEPYRAIGYYEQHLAIAREIGDRQGQATALGNLGNAHADLEKPCRAIGCHEQALAICREIGDRRGEGSCLSNLGLAYAALGDNDRAIEYYEQSIAIARQNGDPRCEGTAIWNTALASDKLDERAKAISLAEKALTIYERIEDPHAATIREQLDQWRSDSAGQAAPKGA